MFYPFILVWMRRTYCNSIDRHLDTVLSWQRPSVNRWSLDKIQGATDRQSIKRRNSFVDRSALYHLSPLCPMPVIFAIRFLSLVALWLEKKKKKVTRIIKYSREETFFPFFSTFSHEGERTISHIRDKNAEMREQKFFADRFVRGSLEYPSREEKDIRGETSDTCWNSKLRINY